MDEELSEPLTPREQEILAAVAHGESNPEIALRLVLSTETVKWYVKQLYGKLDVHNREEAVARARALRLAPSYDAAQGRDEHEASYRFINPLPQDVSVRYVGQGEKLARLAQWISHGARLISLLERIAGRRIIVLLDNLETIQRPNSGELAEPGLQQFLEISLAQTNSLSFIITSREPLALPADLKTWEHVISLDDGLPSNEAVALLRRFDPSGTAGLRDAPAGDLTELAERLGGFPRALESIAGMLLEDPLLTIADVRQRVNSLEGEITVAVVQQALARLSNEALDVLGALAVFGRPAAYEALAHLTAPSIDEATLRGVLGRLIRACFVKANHPARLYALHPIDQKYCYERIPAGIHEMPANAEPFTRATLHRRAAEYYRGQALPRSSWRRLSDVEPQINEFGHLMAAGDIDVAARLLLEIDRDHLWEWGYQDLLDELYGKLYPTPSDPHLAHQVRRRRAWLKFYDAPEQGGREFAEQLQTARTFGWIKEEADALDDLAQRYRRGNRDLKQALDYHRQALALYRQIGDRRGEAEALGGLGAIYAEIDPKEAIEHLLAATVIQRSLGNANSLSFGLATLSASYFYLGLNRQAMEAAQEAVHVARESSSLEALVRAYSALAALHVAAGDVEAGWTFMDEARSAVLAFTGLPITRSLPFWVTRVALQMTLVGHPDAGVALMKQTVADANASLPQIAQFARFLLSLVLTVAGDYQEARSLLPIDPSDELLALSVTSAWVGTLLVKVGEPAAARALLRRSLGFLPGQTLPTATSSSAVRGDRAMVAAALAGLAFVDGDLTLAAEAAEAARAARRSRVRQGDLLAVRVGALCAEPGGGILAPVRDALAAGYE